MTLTELKYIVALAREQHFGKAAKACKVSQPTLSLAIQKLEAALGILIFERQSTPVRLTKVGQGIVAQAQVVLDQTAAIYEIARQGKDPLQGPLRLGVIYTIAPYLLPALVRNTMALTPQMPLVPRENFSSQLLEMLDSHEIDCALLAEPFAGTERFARAPLYDEPFLAAVPIHHPLAKKDSVQVKELQKENLLLLSKGHCFRDQVLSVCLESELPMAASSLQHLPLAWGFNNRFEGSSLETIQHMVAEGLGLTLVPCLSALHPPYQRSSPEWFAASPQQSKTAKEDNPQEGTVKHTVEIGSSNANTLLIKYLPIEPPVPYRRVVLLWRHGFYRHEAIAALRKVIDQCHLPGVNRLSLNTVLRQGTQ